VEVFIHVSEKVSIYSDKEKIIMRILLLGVGMQGKAALHDLFNNPEVSEIVAADTNLSLVDAYIREKGFEGKVTAVAVDGSSYENLNTLFSENFDGVICLLPPMLSAKVAEVAVEKDLFFVNTDYVESEIKALDAKAKEKGIAILSEFGMDPGIDLVLLGEAIRSVDKVESVVSYGAGFPELLAADNPIKYKVTWRFEGVLRSYKRAGRVIRNGALIDIDEDEMFAKCNIHEIEVDELGRLEAFPNGDVMKYVDLLGLDVAELQNAGRYVLRWPGHCEFWYTMVKLGLLDEGTVTVDGVEIDRWKYLATALENHIQYRDNERDIVLVRIEVLGEKNGKKVRSVYQVIDKGDLETGLTAMSRTVGFTAAIGASILGSDRLQKKGVLSPVKDVPYELLKNELSKRHIEITENITEI
jgi:lysine 6-dehydrogenase